MSLPRRFTPSGWRLISLAAAALVIASALRARLAGSPPADDPWQLGDVLTPKQLDRSLHGSKQPVVVSVGPDFLFKSAHIPGALYKGPGKDAEGLESLKAWARNLDRKVEIVLYCGCCPWKQCPNIRPAFAALKAMGFTRLKVMEIEQDFHTDWVKQGYSTEKGN
jgi:thiosulfate/3-mercaptopyruvate sulfurtransferase